MLQLATFETNHRNLRTHWPSLGLFIVSNTCFDRKQESNADFRVATTILPQNRNTVKHLKDSSLLFSKSDHHCLNLKENRPSFLVRCRVS